SETALRYDPTAAFYLLPFRAFELLIGCFLGLQKTTGDFDKRYSGIACLTGVVLITCSFLLLTSNMRFPGLTALVPTVGAGLILWGGRTSSNAVVRVLSLGPVVQLGKLSYSLYLVHWPVILFFDRLNPYTPSGTRVICIVAFSMLLAALSYVFIEQPVQRSRIAQRKVFAWSALALASIIASASIVSSYEGFPERLNKTVSDILAYERYDLKPQFRSRKCFLDPDQSASDLDQDQCIPKGALKMAVLWGDSTAAHLYVGLRPALEKAGYSLAQLTASACPPAVGLEVPARPNCYQFNYFALKTILSLKPALVILAAGWSPSDVLFTGVDSSIKSLNEIGIKPVVLGVPPLYRTSVPKLLAERIGAGNSDPFSGPDLAPGFTIENDIAFGDHYGNRSDVTYISIMATVCPGNQCPMIIDGKIPMHFDPLHLTPAGSSFYANILMSKILP
ncbi:MAG TPA: acyltransferase family protein, partial [Rhizobium sp.]